MIRKRFTYDESVCRKCLTDEEDIAVIRDLAMFMPVIADLMDSNIFLDCPTDDPDMALCVAEAFPAGGDPLYSNCPVGYDCPRENEPAALRTLSLGVIGRDVRGVSQEMFPILQVTVPVFGKDPKKPIGVLIKEHSPDEQEKAEQKLAFIQKSASGFTDAVYGLNYQDFNIPDEVREAIVTFDANGIVTYRSMGAVKLYRNLGYQEDILGMSFENVVLTDHTFAECESGIYELIPVSVGSYDLEIKYSTTGGGEKDRLCMLVHDVTGEDEARKKLRLQSFLISEMNHRIKNNLQMVASLLNLQANSIYDESIRQMFYESINRVQSIAEVHNQLSLANSESAEMMALSSSICTNISKLAELEYSVEGEECYLPAEKASAYGLVINELIQNVIKHAEPPAGEKKRAWVIINPGMRYVNVEVRDNGKGFPEVLEKNLGLQLVFRLVNENLGGKIEITNGENGSVLSIVFPK